MAESCPTFGALPAGVSAQERQAAYVVVRDCGRVAAVKGRGGRYFLPGGGSLAGETPVDTVMREVLEELGQSLVEPSLLGEARQYFFSAEDKQWYVMETAFFRASLSPTVASGHVTAEFALEWIAIDDPERVFFHACHAWAASRG